MPSTTVHIPDEILSRIDKVVSDKKISRNRFIIEACEKALDSAAGEWPKGFFDMQMDHEEFRLLTEAGLELESAIIRLRRNRNRIDL